MGEYEVCREQLEDHNRWYQQKGRNEATTRLALIDRLFIQCLGWSIDDITSEESHDGDYADYTFSAPRRILIVEAKKEGDYFELPAGQTKILHSLRTLRKDHPNLEKAVQQVTNYCNARGVPFAVVANGHQIVAFVANRNDGCPPLDGQAIVFDSIDSMLSNFLQLWDALSKPGVEERRLYRNLIGSELPELPRKLAASLPDYPGLKNRNVFQTQLQILSDLVIEEIPKSQELEAEFLRECYCQSGALSQHSLMTKSVLEARYAALMDSIPTVVRATEKNKLSSDLLVDSFTRRPILLIGDVGVGKSSFIRNLFKIAAAEVFENAISFYLNLGVQATLSVDLKTFVLEEISSQLRSTYQVDIEERNFVRHIYQSELKRFGAGIFGDLRESNPILFQEKEVSHLAGLLERKDTHLRHCLNFLSRSRKKQIVLVLDNADQRDYETQQQAFLIAQELADQWPIAVFVALRPDTFYRSIQSGALSGYHPKAFTIAPPRADRVIERRLTYALSFATGERPLPGPLGDVTLQLFYLAAVIRAFLLSTSNMRDLIAFIDNISGGNMRLALDLVRGFFGSGHVDTQKIADIVLDTGEYRIPLHEFLRAVIYGDGQYYDPQRSPVANVFDVSQVDAKEHFLTCLLVSSITGSDPTSEYGFVESARVYDRLQSHGFTPQQIDAAVVRSVRKKLIDTTARRVQHSEESVPQALRPTSIGLYHVSKLCREFAYADAVIVDTPILDESVRSQIHDVLKIRERLERTEVFRAYLDDCWIRSGLDPTSFDWPGASSELKENIEYIKRKSSP